MRRPVLLSASAVVLLAACRTEQTWIEPDPHLERMLTQPKRLAFDEDPLLPHAMAMQSPPEGTMPTDTLVNRADVSLGEADGHWVSRFPLSLDRASLEQGRANFETFCAACHGILGDGSSVVGAKMSLRPPPSLQEERITRYPVGRIFRTIRQGYGLMPSYAVQLSVRETWGVVAYLRALQTAYSAGLANLPSEARGRPGKEAM